MASKITASLALLISLNLLFFTLVSGCNTCYSSSPTPKPKSTPKSTPKPTPSPYEGQYCPIDTLKLGVCANVLGGLLNVVVGTPPKKECCSLISDLVDLQAAVCLCTTIKAYLLGIKLDVPLSLSLLLNGCGKKVPKGFQCAY